LNRSGTIDTVLPAALAEASFASRYAPWVLGTLLLATAGLSLTVEIRASLSRRHRSPP
jgi:hypothetical protein